METDQGVIEPETAVRYLSVSKIELAAKCGFAFRFRYVDKVPEASSGIMLAGRVVHKIIEKALKQQLFSGKLPSPQDMDDQFEGVWEEQKKEEEEKPGFYTWQYDPEDPEAIVKRESRAIVRLARDEAIPHVRPTHVEHDINFDIDDEKYGRFRIYGVIDILEQGGLISDWKTVKYVSKNQLRLGLQFPGYSDWLVKHASGGPVTKARKLFLIRKSPPKFEVKDYEIEQRHRDWFETCAKMVWRMTKSGGYVPTAGAWWCSKKFCSFWDGCMGQLEDEHE